MNLQRRVFSRLSPVEQQLIALNITGGFQTNAIKHKWDDDIQTQCDHCSQYDSRSHRLLTCEAATHIRATHPEAVEVLATTKVDWQYLPISTFGEDYVIFKKIGQLPEATQRTS